MTLVGVFVSTLTVGTVDAAKVVGLNVAKGLGFGVEGTPVVGKFDGVAVTPVGNVGITVGLKVVGPEVTSRAELGVAEGTDEGRLDGAEEG